MSETLKVAHELKEAYCEWFDWAKTKNDVIEVKKRLLAFYRKVEETKLPAFLKAIQTLKNWQVEILSSFSFDYSNGFLEGINNKTKVMNKKRCSAFADYLSKGEDSLYTLILLNASGNWEIHAYGYKDFSK